jgi:hypothetical protein
VVAGNLGSIAVVGTRFTFELRGGVHFSSFGLSANANKIVEDARVIGRDGALMRHELRCASFYSEYRRFAFTQKSGGNARGQGGQV